MSTRSIGAEPTTSIASSTSSSATRAMSPMISRRVPLATRVGPERGIAQEQLGIASRGSAVDVEQHAVAGGGVVVAPAHALEDRVAVEPLGAGSR